jgi:acetyltransferase-like isoleucine patch superfamily enzyme
MRWFYQAMGAKLGADTYNGGTIMDPCLVRVGSNCIIGQGALVIPHQLVGERLEHHAVSMGDNVTVGARVVVLCGTRIGSGAIIAAGAVVAPFSQIGAGETWAGVPARRVDRTGK